MILSDFFLEYQFEIAHEHFYHWNLSFISYLSCINERLCKYASVKLDVDNNEVSKTV